MTAEQLEDPEGRALVAKIHERKQLFGLRVETDDAIPPGTALLKDAKGNIVGMMTGLR